MHNTFHKRRYGYTLIELMLVLGITATLLAIMMYRHSYTLTHSTFNQDCELMAATLKETGPQAKKLGMLLPASLMELNHPAKKGATSTVVEQGYALWVICERKSNSSDAKRVVTSSGVLSHRAPVTVKVSQAYADDVKQNITTGVWMDIYDLGKNSSAINTKFDYTSANNNLQLGSPKARIIFEPNMTPRRAGVITITLSEGKSDIVRSQRIDIERSGVITHNTENSGNRLE